MRHPRQWRRVVAVAAIFLSVTALTPREAAAASCSGQSHHTVLSAGGVFPASGTTATSFGFTVTYTDNAGCVPDRMEVVIDGVGAFSMALVSGDLSTGAAFRRDLTLPAGRWTYRFESTSGTGAGLETFTLTTVVPPDVVVVAPTPVPTPVPTPTPTPVPTPTPRPRPTATPTKPPGPTPAPTESSSATQPGPAPTPTAAARAPGKQGELPGGSDPPSAPLTGSSVVPSPAAGGAGAIVGGPLPSAGTGDEPGSRAWTSSLDLGMLPRPVASLAVASISTIVGLGLFAVLAARLLWFGPARGRLAPAAGARRRRTDTPLAAVAAVPSPDASSPEVVIDPARAASIRRAPILFGASPPQGADRCRVSSRLVPLRSEPNAVDGRLLGRLDIGDEVDVLRQEGTHCYVRTPSGAEGWVPGLALAGGPRTMQPGGTGDGS